MTFPFKNRQRARSTHARGKFGIATQKASIRLLFFMELYGTWISPFKRLTVAVVH